MSLSSALHAAMSRVGGLAILAALSLLPVVPAHAQQTVAPASLHVESSPTGAIVEIDGKRHGVTPLGLASLRPGKHLIKIGKKGYFDEFKTVELRPADRQTLTTKLMPVTGLVLVKSDPDGVDLQLNGIDRGKTPLLMTDLVPGDYRMTLNKPGYISKTVSMGVVDRVPLQLSYSLTSDFATLDVTSTPSGAEVMLSGIDKGRTPCRIERVATGDSTIQLALQGYAPYSETIRLSAGESQQLKATLKPIASKLRIVSIPPKARVYVDDQFRGSAPVQLDGLAPGSFRIRAELPGFDTTFRTVSVGLAQDTIEEFRLTANTGTIKLTTEPAGVDVILDGKPVGTTQAQINETDRISEPLTIDGVAAGTHTLKFVGKGLFEKVIKAAVTRNQTFTSHVALDRRFIPNYEIRTSSQSYRGVYISQTPSGGIKMELSPGITKSFTRSEIISGQPLRSEVPPAGASD
jgi:hypothetical protein